MLPANLETPREVTRYYDSVYEDLIASGEAVPFIYPWAGLGAFAVIGYLLIDHRRCSWTRYPVYASLVGFQAWCIQTNRAKHPAAAFGVGLLSGWGLLWVFALTVAKDCQADFLRLESKAPANEKRDHQANGSAANGTLSKANARVSDSPERTNKELYWQRYPSKLVYRLDWIADVFCSFRGVGWNYETNGVPRLPKQIEAKLHASIGPPGRPEETTMSKSGIRRIADRKQLLYICVKDLITGYFMLDIIKTLMARDRYFIGYVDAAPPTYLPDIVQSSSFLLRGQRLLLSLVGIYFALREIFTLGPFFFSILLGPKYLGLRGEPWMNPPDMFGSYFSVLDHGIAGWWGGWWHQVFRYGFEAPTERLLDALGIAKKSTTGKLMSLVVAFTLSGCLHACGSYTQLGDTRPIAGPLRFFMLQPVGIVGQLLATQALKQLGIRDALPKTIRQAGNFVFVHIWLYYTAPLLMDDFAKGGVWLYEPLVFSPLRGLGYGAKDDGFFCWWNGIFWWRSGKTWWDTGVAF